MADADVPEACPGTASESAGKASACAGCPMQKMCASGEAAKPDPAVAVIAERMKAVKHKVLVLSGKGGVGKSSFSAQLSLGLAGMDQQVGLLDIDICGPSQPKMMGVEGEQVHQSSLGWSPVYPVDNLGVISIGFLLNNADEAVIWRGPKKNGMIKQFLKDVHWGDELDYLVVDCPPGTSDEHLSATQYLADASVDGAVILTTPQELSLLDVRKEINFCRKVGLNILGVVENMSGFVCPKCSTETPIFPPTTGGAEKMCSEMGVKFLGKLPLDVELMKCCEEGRAYLSGIHSHDDPALLSAAIAEESRGQQALRAIVNNLRTTLESA
eukprot:CAMPEP_0181295440 /NCGR_PEP_ID=MMETSP1101-20121128/4153_1 /TAXON_ID=46948 /ORGANISM="Rhodomonas abbreviata, Strain Caron Lab Isolate" /LENGTH=326 /DNA_ID=CAMNT_0023400201 /DNA_START=60 /DNA_END=1040 /DNA_ORIENTATION=+